MNAFPMRRTRMLLAALVTLALIPTAGPRAAQAAPTLSLAIRQQDFDIVWSRVNDDYYDPTFNGVDWNAVRAKYAPRVATVKSDQEYYSLLQQMLGELKRSHFAIIPPTAYAVDEDSAPDTKTPPSAHDSKMPAVPAKPDASASQGPGDIGTVIEQIGNQAVVTRVAPSSAAEKAGLRTGYVVTKIGKISMATLIERLKHSEPTPALQEAYLELICEAHLNGEAGTPVTLDCLDGGNKKTTFTITRTLLTGTPVTFGELPTLYANLETRRLPNGIGYIRFNAFLIPLIEPIRAAIRQMHDAPAIIIDVRDNPGGVGLLASSVAAEFYGAQSTLGTMTMRHATMNFVIFPTDAAYTKPVAVLIDEASLSTSEILAGGLQENGRALVVGRPSGGMVLPSQIERLPGGIRLQYAIADFRTPKGVLLEGRGVTPDINVILKRADLLAGHDPVLDAASAALEARISAAQSTSGTKGTQP